MLLIIDYLNSNTSPRAIDFARDNGLVILTIFPHTSHKLRPLDTSVFSPFKRAYSVVSDDWKACNVGEKFSINEVAEGTAKAYDVAFTHNNIKAGFRANGIWPFDRNIFTESDVLPSKPTDLPQDEDPVATSMRCRGQVTRTDEANHCYREALSAEEWLRASETPHESLVEGQVSSPAGQNLPCTSSASRPVEGNCVSQRRGGELEPEVDDGNATVADTSDISVKHSRKSPTNQATVASPEVVSPVPKAKRSIPKQKSKNKGDTLILTSNPVKMKLSLRKVKPVRPSPKRRKKRHQVRDKLVVSRKLSVRKFYYQLRVLIPARTVKKLIDNFKKTSKSTQVTKQKANQIKTLPRITSQGENLSKMLMKIFAIMVGMSSLIANPMNNGQSAAEVKIENAAGNPMLFVWTMKEALTRDAFYVNFELTGPH